eukprot:9490258-Pyramimonas_sp.AAC.1
MAQDSARCLMLHEAPNTFQDGSKRPPRPPRRPPRKPRKINDCCFLAFSLPMQIRGLMMAPRWPMRAPGEAQESPKMAPKAPKERSERGPGGDS